MNLLILGILNKEYLHYQVCYNPDMIYEIRLTEYMVLYYEAVRYSFIVANFALVLFKYCVSSS